MIGLVAGYIRWLDAIVLRLMDGLMAIPAILLAIGLIAVFRAGLWSVIVAIIVPEVPRVVRLVRAIVLSVREEPYVEAAICAGTPTPLLLVRHILPNTVPALIVQGTFICANAMLIEAILSFLGVGIPPETPTWGNIMAEGRSLFRLFPHNIFFPGICLALTVLAVNMLGDGLRDRLDPKTGEAGLAMTATKPVLDVHGLTVRLPPAPTARMRSRTSRSRSRPARSSASSASPARASRSPRMPSWACCRSQLTPVAGRVLLEGDDLLAKSPASCGGCAATAWR